MTHPILFQPNMVRAIISGTKTQTRREVKPQPPNGSFYAGVCTYSIRPKSDVGKYGFANCEKIELLVNCPYGKKGDVLWVRETFGMAGRTTKHYVYKANTESKYDKPESGWKPSIHMPKAACRIWLQITDIRVQRVREITEADAISEGAAGYCVAMHPVTYDGVNPTPIEDFKQLWVDINGPESWIANPWVWAITFQRIEMPKNFLTEKK